MNDLEIRRLLRPTLRPSTADAVIVDELGILQGSARADVAVVDHLLHGYEIKSASDSRARLGWQVAAYSRVFDRATIVTEANHLRAVLTVVPAWWGVLVAADDVLGEHRPAVLNEAVDARSVAELLWAEDVVDLLAVRNAARGFRGKARRFLWDRLCEVYSGDEVRAAARRVLRERHGPPPDEQSSTGMLRLVG